MKRVFSFIIMIAGTCSSPAQVKCSLNKAYAYYTVSIPGTQMVDEKGNPVPPVPVVERFIYLDIKGNTGPAVQSVTYNNMPMTAGLTKLEGITVSIGKRYEDQKEIVARTKKGNSLWKLELKPMNDGPPTAAACKNIVMRLKLAGKTCTYRISAGENQLYTPPAY